MSRSNPTTTKRTIIDRKARLGFGKYAKETVQDILDNYPEYFLWLDENTDIEIACDILTEAQENATPNHEFKGWTDRCDFAEHADRQLADGQAADIYEPF